jgi:hypothetical protein
MIERSCPTSHPCLAAEQNRADALQCTGDKHQAERTSFDCETDRLDDGFLSRRFMARSSHRPKWVRRRLRWVSSF